MAQNLKVMLKFTANDTNTFAGTFAFYIAQFNAQKKQKSQQANAQ
jgi:hypothetical protein